MPAGPGHLKRGGAGEKAAEKYLRRRGFKVLARNWRSGSLEIDLVCRHGEVVVFVEVKTRDEGGPTRAVESLGRQKAERLVRAASLWLSENDAWHLACRFDLAAVTAGNDGYEVHHVQDVVDVAQALGGGHAHWQPF
ncbi:YraN family protein [Desulfohalovibrio reitneri]|uniref:YraN family protein n=1 Tax=Desulfohalovibrio reitneri TaxID=1307759 RepID=UPI0004A6AC32|nr:YraN family protein [Desulfohalovibrio reitneri]